jgi:hypothetical protein
VTGWRNGANLSVTFCCFSAADAELYRWAMEEFGEPDTAPDQGNAG